MNDHLTFKEYQRRAAETAIYPREYAIVYPTLGLIGEAGEVCQKIKKAMRDHGGVVDKDAIAAEIGDCLWYLAALASDLEIPLSCIVRPIYPDNFIGFQEQAYDFSIYQRMPLRFSWPAVTASISPNLALPTRCSKAAVAAAVHMAREATLLGGESVHECQTHPLVRDALKEFLKEAACLASELGLSLEAIARANLAKLADRAARGKLHGDGDKR